MDSLHDSHAKRLPSILCHIIMQLTLPAIRLHEFECQPPTHANARLLASSAECDVTMQASAAADVRSAPFSESDDSAAAVMGT